MPPPKRCKRTKKRGSQPQTRANAIFTIHTAHIKIFATFAKDTKRKNGMDKIEATANIRHTIGAICVALFLVLAPATGKSRIRVMSYNMLFEHNKPTQVERQWASRLPNLLKSIRRDKPDVIGSQEIQTFQVEQFVEKSGYGWIGNDISRGDRNHPKAENEAIFYRKDKLEPMESGMIWFSETPLKAGTYSWGMKYPRACTWAKFRVKATGKMFYILNSHFYVDPDKEEARMNAAKLIVEKIKEIGGDFPVICTGDLNNSIESRPIQSLLSEGGLYDSFSVAEKRKGPAGSFHGFNTKKTPTDRIDHILVSSGIRVKKYEIIDRQWRTGKFESDHLPVCADIVLP